MREVSKDEFFAAIGKLNVHPRSEEYRSVWEVQDGTRRVIGISTPGYKGPFDRPKTYKLVE